MLRLLKWKSRFKLDYEISVLALITFIMSAGSLTWQAANHWQGASVRLIDPDQIEIGSTEAFALKSRDDRSYVNFIVGAVFVNEGASNYNAVTLRERLKIKFKDGPGFEHRGYWFATTSLDQNDRRKIIVTKSKDALPFTLAAGSSESHDTLYQPWPKDCRSAKLKCNERENYVEWSEFISLLRTKHEIEFEIDADLASGQRVIPAKCVVRVDGKALEKLIADGWSSRVCLNSAH